jgi:tripartite-type tricarboxylate transporter receptor subunit TctC
MGRLLTLTTVAAALLAAGPARAQTTAADYPGKPVKIIVNVGPGGGVDTATRIVGERLRVRLGQPFVIENRPGAGGNIGAEVVFQSEPDGYTLLSSSPSPLAINGWLYKKLNFDPAGFEPVAMMSRIPNVLVVRHDFPARSVQDFIAHAKANPGELNYASQGIGTASHLTAELFMTLTGTRLVHVPYKSGTAAALTDLVAGHVDLSFIQFSSVHELHQGGKARACWRSPPTGAWKSCRTSRPWPKPAFPTWCRKPGTRSARRRRPPRRSSSSSTRRSTKRCASPRSWRASANCRSWSAAATRGRPESSSRTSVPCGAR